LGLELEPRYVVFDFWNRKLLGTFRDRVVVDVDGHDSRVLLIHKLLDRPQLIGISRHISGAFSVRELSWDSTKTALRGTADTVPGVPYTVYIHVPPGVTVLKAGAVVGASQEIPVSFDQKAELLSATFEGGQGPVRWEVGFGRPSKH
jgi:hypothetical protein